MNELQNVIYHAMQNYDPAKAHEYYLRTRKLKGRHPGGPDNTSGRSGGGGNPNTKGSRPVHQPSLPQHMSYQDQAHARVAALTKRLDHLKDVLAELVKKSKERAGVKTPETSSSSSKTSSSSKSGSSKDGTKSTAEEKRKAHDYYEKNKKTEKKDPSTQKQIEELNASIKEVEAKIQKIRADLKASVKNARDQSTNKTAPNGR